MNMVFNKQISIQANPNLITYRWDAVYSQVRITIYYKNLLNSQKTTSFCLIY